MPVTLWFFDKGKSKSERKDKVLFIDARSIFHEIAPNHRGFTYEQIGFLANIVRLYRGEEPYTIAPGSDKMLEEKFPEGEYVDVAGLWKIATVQEIEAQDWSLNPELYLKNSNLRSHAMNNPQRTVLAVGAGLIFLMLLFPPFERRMAFPVGGNMKLNLGYHFIFWGGALTPHRSSQPIPGSSFRPDKTELEIASDEDLKVRMEAMVNIPLLLTQWMGVILITGIAFVLAKGKNRV